ncbi:MAG: geopeptide [Geobacteraceae bacterium GWC2_58_44]|nr:MAG: geopeptide [Geobacteraceae bacterium GWC2_58_44]HBG04193.1 geopeptide [Geobacter sp.]
MAEIIEGLVVIDEGKDTESTEEVSCCWSAFNWLTGY